MSSIYVIIYNIPGDQEGKLAIRTCFVGLFDKYLIYIALTTATNNKLLYYTTILTSPY
jgi:hypothetical protein